MEWKQEIAIYLGGKQSFSLQGAFCNSWGILAIVLMCGTNLVQILLPSKTYVRFTNASIQQLYPKVLTIFSFQGCTVFNYGFPLRKLSPLLQNCLGNEMLCFPPMRSEVSRFNSIVFPPTCKWIFAIVSASFVTSLTSVKTTTPNTTCVK